MSFIIALHVQEGLVFASDSRITFNSSTIREDGTQILEKGVYFSDAADKTFLTKSDVGISMCGDALVNGQSIACKMKEFVDFHQNGDVEVIKNSIIQFFKGMPNINTSFIIGGYITNENGTKTQKLYHVNTATEHVETYDTTVNGAAWDGELDILNRLIIDAYQKSEKDNHYSPIINYGIVWDYMILQDAIDFARYAVKTTIDTMHFQRRAQTVGGPIDILVIKPNSSQWISRKELK